jgi:O-acetyl-ADP-ribose deacetylase (regulator of RNase III)
LICYTIIINVPTKTDWRKPSEYDYVKKGLEALARIIQERHIKSIAIPALGAGAGKLDWATVRKMFDMYLPPLACDVFIYQPNAVM